MTDFVTELEAELLKAARRRTRPRAPRVALRPVLVLAVALAAFAFVVRGGGAPDPERTADRPPVTTLPVTGCTGDGAVAGGTPERVLAELALLRRVQIDADPVDARTLPVRTYDAGHVRRVGALTVVPAGGIRDCASGPDRAAEGACVVRGAVARCFTLGEIRAGRAFALVEERGGSRLIGLVGDGPTRVVVGAHGAVAAVEVEQNTVDERFEGLRPTDDVRLELQRRTAQILVLNETGTKGRGELEAVRLRARLDVGVLAEEHRGTRERTVVTSTSTKSNGLAKETAELLEADRVELAPEGSDAKPTTPGVIVTLGKERMR